MRVPRKFILQVAKDLLRHSLSSPISPLRSLYPVHWGQFGVTSHTSHKVAARVYFFFLFDLFFFLYFFIFLSCRRMTAHVHSGCTVPVCTSGIINVVQQSVPPDVYSSSSLSHGDSSTTASRHYRIYPYFRQHHPS